MQEQLGSKLQQCQVSFNFSKTYLVSWTTPWFLGGEIGLKKLFFLRIYTITIEPELMLRALCIEKYFCHFYFWYYLCAGICVMHHTLKLENSTDKIRRASDLFSFLCSFLFIFSDEIHWYWLFQNRQLYHEVCHA